VREIYVKWWLKALSLSVVWIVLCFVGFQLLFPGPTTPEQDAKLSEWLGEACGFGLTFIWLLSAWMGGRFRLK
jgi:hypothetical protein